MMELIRRPSGSLGASIFNDLDRLFDDMLEPLRTSNRQLSLPSVDIYNEDDSNMVVEMQAPGFSRDHIKISVSNGFLEIRGEKTEKQEHKDKKRSYIVRENSSSFYRRIPLPEGADGENIAAELDDGVLRLTVPVQRKQAKQIQIAESKKVRQKLPQNQIVFRRLSN